MPGLMIRFDEASPVKITELDWDSSVFGIKCGRVDIRMETGVTAEKELEELLGYCLSEARRGGFRFLTAKIGREFSDAAKSCKNNGGILIDTELTFTKLRGPDHVPAARGAISDNISIVKHEKFWDDRLFEIAGTVELSRFFQDKNIAKEQAEALWRKSIYNNCNSRASYSIVCFSGKRPVGLMNLFEKWDVSDIFLIALISEYQNMGLGKSMLAFYEANLDPCIKVQTVETQMSNLRAKKCYTDMGYKVTYEKDIFHFWL